MDNLKMQTFGQRLLQSRIEAGLSQSEVQAKIGIKQGSLSALENDEVVKSTYTIDLAHLYGVDVFWLASGRGKKNVSSSSAKMGKVPVISWVKAGEFCNAELVLDWQTAEEWRYCPVKHSEQTFVLVLDGISMSPEYPDKSEIFVDPSVMPLHNDDVVACVDNGSATFKRLQITSEGKYLLALNPDWKPKIIQFTENTIVCGVVIYSGIKRR
jgi:SOS-response transcriptional repressor LexA